MSRSFVALLLTLVGCASHVRADGPEARTSHRLMVVLSFESASQEPTPKNPWQTVSRLEQKFGKVRWIRYRFESPQDAFKEFLDVLSGRRLNGSLLPDGDREHIARAKLALYDGPMEPCRDTTYVEDFVKSGRSPDARTLPFVAIGMSLPSCFMERVQSPLTPGVLFSNKDSLATDRESFFRQVATVISEGESEDAQALRRKLAETFGDQFIYD